MKHLLALALALWASAALAQPVTQPSPVGAAGAYNSSAPTCTTGNFCWLQLDVNGNLKTVAAGTPTGTSDVNIKQVQGAAPSATNPLWVAPATASTPWATTQVSAATGGATYLNIAAGQATTVVKGTPGTLYAIVLNSAATATNTTVVYDNATGAGTVIGRPAVVTATVPSTLSYGPNGIAFALGLTIITATANGGDMTVVFK